MERQLNEYIGNLAQSVFNWYWAGKLLPEGWRADAKRQYLQRYSNGRHILEIWNGSKFEPIAECKTIEALEAAKRLLTT